MQDCLPCQITIETNNYWFHIRHQRPDNKKLIFSGLIQMDYNCIGVEDGMGPGMDCDDGDPPCSTFKDRNDFLMRRLPLGFYVDLGNWWQGVFVLNFSGQRTHKVLRKANYHWSLKYAARKTNL